MKKMRLFVKWCLLGVVLPAAISCAVDAAELKGSVSVERNNARQITRAFLHVGNQPYSIIMDENGRSLAQMYEHKELKVECTINGDQIKLDTWEEIKPPPSARAPVYDDPEPKYEEEDEKEVNEDGDQQENDEDSQNQDDNEGEDSDNEDSEDSEDSEDKEDSDNEDNEDKD